MGTPPQSALGDSKPRGPTVVNEDGGYEMRRLITSPENVVSEISSWAYITFSIVTLILLGCFYIGWRQLARRSDLQHAGDDVTVTGWCFLKCRSKRAFPLSEEEECEGE